LKEAGLAHTKQVLVDGPSDEAGKDVPRHAAALSHLSLTPIVIKKLPLAAGNGAIKAAWKKAEVEQKWDSSSWAQSRAKSAKRRALTDFERFKVMRLRKQVGSHFSIAVAWRLRAG